MNFLTSVPDVFNFEGFTVFAVGFAHLCCNVLLVSQLNFFEVICHALNFMEEKSISLITLFTVCTLNMQCACVRSMDWLTNKVCLFFGGKLQDLQWI